MTTALIIHGHFYQPPRENPWTNTIEAQPSARPFPNWNERIHRECYRPNGYARVIDARGRVERIVNNYANISFNFGPTLISWLEQHHPQTYARIIEADRASCRRQEGHGNAIAQGYHHAILPLCNERDRRTEIRWGLYDFRRRYGRDAESLWLPETAVNDATLGALIDAGLKFVILSPHQAERVRPIGADVWQSVIDGNVDPSVPFRYFHRDGSGRSIVIFFYDGHVAKAIAFDGALASSHVLLDRFERAASNADALVNVATDGESYGHHFIFGDRTLAYALEVEARERGFEVTNYGAFLATHEPKFEVEIKAGPDGEGTAWSCAHGIGRWTRDCSCHAGAREGWHQKWRTPLRAALNFLRDEAARHFETLGGELFRDPWAARDAYIELLIDRTRNRAEFFAQQTGRPLSEEEQVRALTLLELQRSALTMFTSCGWFFNDISGIETVQDLKYAGRVMDFLGELKLKSPRGQFLEILADAESNLPQFGNGADIYRRFVDGARVTMPHVAASLAIASLVDQPDEADELAGYAFKRSDLQQQQHGRLALATARLDLAAIATGKRQSYAAAAMHFGDVDFYCVLREFTNDEEFAAAADKLWSSFRTASLPTLFRLMQDEFGPRDYGLEHLLPEGRKRIYEIVFGQMVARFAEEYERLYEENRRNIEMLQGAGFELPTELRAAAEFTIGRRFERELLKLEQADPSAYPQASEIAEEVARHGYHIDRVSVQLRLEEMLMLAVERAVAQPVEVNYQAALALITLAQQLKLDANIERVQEIVYEAIRTDGEVPAGLRELAEQLHLAPVLLQPPAADEAKDDRTETDVPEETTAQAEVLVQPEAVAVSLEPKLEGAV
jgi:alpha-amylase/alpha-mannosidase (GH57 family)